MFARRASGDIEILTLLVRCQLNGRLARYSFTTKSWYGQCREGSLQSLSVPDGKRVQTQLDPISVPRPLNFFVDL